LGSRVPGHALDGVADLLGGGVAFKADARAVSDYARGIVGLIADQRDADKRNTSPPAKAGQHSTGVDR
jgi:hypothetical protein